MACYLWRDEKESDKKITIFVLANAKQGNDKIIRGDQ